MKFIAIIAVFSIIALTILIALGIQKFKEAQVSKLKNAIARRDLYRNQLVVAKKALEIERDLGNSNAELALLDIAKLQYDYEDQHELTSG
jgi:hypothetical protein